MDHVLALTLQSMQHDMKRVERVGTNLANALTPAYKREMIIERPFSELISDQIDNRQNAVSIDDGMLGLEVVSDQRAGTLKPTGQKLDLALAGEGFFEISTSQGAAYTRQGNFQLDARGRLVTLHGDPVMGKNGEIFLTSNQPNIDSTGKVIDFDPSTVGNLNELGIAQLKIVQFDKSTALKKGQFGLFFADDNAVISEVKKPQVVQGSLENSNVSSMEEMVHLMQAMRHFESMVKVTQGYDEMMGSAIKKLGDTS